MTTTVRPGMSTRASFGRLRAATLCAVVAGAGGSVALMLRAGRRHPSGLLLVLFACWVLAPFAALGWATVVSARWSGRTRATLYGVTLLIACGSLGLYGAVALGPPRPKPAAAFVVVPPASGLLAAAAVSVAVVARRRFRRGDRP